ncbi:P-loop containing nucleoside triphosphate hydrolase protein [Aureobasidium sp. EXF-10727]|nr:P-loop containing nucleoside triphosphate hydrolase protein [Aureobasidium sp. EXF-10727]
MADTQGTSRPTVDDLTGDNHYAQLARKHWLNKTKQPKVQRDVVEKELWTQLEQEDFGSLLLLEQLQLLDLYLWPGYTDDASNHHVLLLAMLVNVKRREGLAVWDCFLQHSENFSSLFRRILSMTIDTTIATTLRTHLLTFIIIAYQSLDSGIVRKECAPLVNIAIWHNLHSEQARDGHLDKAVQLQKAWRAANKRYDGSDAPTQARLRFERSWLYSLILDFFDRLYDTTPKSRSDNVLYCERFVELLSDLQSQLPTRRFVNTLLQDLNTLSVVKLSPMYADEDNALLRDLYNLLQHYTTFPIEDHSGRQYTSLEFDQQHHAALTKLQRVSFKHFQDKLKILVLANFASLATREDLQSHLTSLSDDEVIELCGLLGFRTDYPSSTLVTRDRTFYMEILLSAHESVPMYQQTMQTMAVVPTESTIYDSAFVRNESYNGTRPLAIPKLNLQYLTMGDFLWRSFVLYRAEAFYQIRKDIEDTVKRLQPRKAGPATKFDGFSKMAIPITKPALIDVAPAKVSELHPSKVEVEVTLDVGRLGPNIRKEWETLRSGDVVFLVSVQVGDTTSVFSNGGSESADVADRHGVKHVRSSEVINVLDENGRMLRDQTQAQTNGVALKGGRQRRLLLRLDPVAYQQDKERTNKGKPDILESINLLVRRQGRENNFKSILDSIKHLALSDVPAPQWLQEVFLGYSDPAAATYQRLPNRLNSIDYRDTFLDWQHLVESLPGKTVEPDAQQNSSFPPPYVLETTAAPPAEARPTKRRKREQVEAAPAPAVEAVKVGTYKPANPGPYPVDAPKLNSVRFTPTQIEAITSGTQPGLTVIVGPPGTGKTDVATQIINNIYHNFPEQRTLLVAHSNQALNQLFQKITALDIDERHLLRLGHGEEELETEASYSKHGRVESFMENAAVHLYEVSRLAASIGAPGAHGSSCETADYFNQVYVKPAWTKYWDAVNAGAEPQQIIDSFPFHAYFANAPQPLFPATASREALVDVASGCNNHLDHIFASLADTRPFEILRTARDKANYLLIKEARIIAMTSTHAAMRRQEIADLGFRYDNVIMEEAAQVTEIENFIPLALQKPRDGEMKLQRVVLVGDHLQNSPIVQNLAFRQYANLEQSLFLRLVRLGVPTITLNQQGRARPSLAELYKWRYPTLGNLPLVTSSPQFLQANAGFAYDYQFIDVPDYKGKGETEPSPHFIQNLGEAEYAVAIYMYMRLLGYPAEKISILTTYAGQRALVRDVLKHRCQNNRMFGLPGKVSTVDKYQGEQNDYIILSLTRTSRPGYLRDIRRLTVALSRARLGLYVLGRRQVFSSTPDLATAFSSLLSRPANLSLATGEMFPTQRSVENQGTTAEMEGVEHLGQYVFEMTKAKVEAIKKGEGVLPPVSGARDEEMEDEEVYAEDEVVADEEDVEMME